MAGIYRKIEDVPEWIVPFVEKRIIKTFNPRMGGYAESTFFAKTVIPISEMLIHDHELNPHLKWKVSGICTKCGNEFITTWNELCHRKKHTKEHFCGKCLRKEQFTLDWRKHNSEAQKKVQGTKEARERMSKILKEKHKNNPELRDRISDSLKEAYRNHPEFREKISKASKRCWDNPEYQTKVTGNNFYHGYYQSRFGEIYFASSWELLFLDWLENNSAVTFFKRSEDKIDYSSSDGSHFRYFPDFEVEMNNEKFIFEIKGKINMLEVENKRLAAEKFYEGKKTYILMFKHDLQRIGIKFGKVTFHQKLVSLIGKIRDGRFGKEEITSVLKRKGYL